MRPQLRTTTNLPVLGGVEAFVDAEAAAVELVISSADDRLQIGHVLFQLRVDVLIRARYSVS